MAELAGVKTAEVEARGEVVDTPVPGIPAPFKVLTCGELMQRRR